MAILSIDDFKRKLSDKIVDNDDLVIELLEDVDDSFTPRENEELEEMKKLMLEKDAEVETIEEKVPEEVEEKEVIDIKEI